MATSTVSPLNRSIGVPSTVTVTGNEATPCDDVATVPTEVTVPVVGADPPKPPKPPKPLPPPVPDPPVPAPPVPVAPVPVPVPVAAAPRPAPVKPKRPPPSPVVVAPAADEEVMVAGWPVLIRLIWVSSTLRLTTKLVLMTWTSGFDEEFEEPDVEDAGVCDIPELVPVPCKLVAPAPLLPSCSPTVRLTTDTVPAIGEVSEASARFAWAVARLALAAARLAWSALVWAAEAPDDTSESTLAWSWATVALAWATLLWRLAELTVARTWPAVTVWPACTLTAVTWPGTVKFRLSVVAGSRVPETETVWRMLPIVAATSRDTVLTAAEAWWCVER